MSFFTARLKYAWVLLPLAAVLVCQGFDSRAAGSVSKVYVGSEACQDCHDEQYERFSASAQKAHGFDSIQVMKKGLSADELESCYACHTTGYGEPGGFRSEAETPHLKNPGCEVCHGPGSTHVESEDPDDIKGEVTIEDCNRCHTNDRINAFHFKPLLKAGAH